MKKMGEEAVAGFFEDIPVLLVVVIATGIFLFSLVHAYGSYLDQVENDRMHENAQSLSENFRNYRELTDGFREGVFMASKLDDLDPETLDRDFNETALGYHFQMAIIDCSDYNGASNYTTSFGNSNPPVDGGRYTVTTSILLKVDHEFHAARMIVTIWS